ncbi:rab3 GTPase-activating protein catalytic subunit-like [Lingula anatina]|uniref:Rab3 GTPase-activating protein catalytic subunit n=1 Tax=Lingula anatina TaxID=7574 RepID=A0A1S3IEP1_LINAN|nr:rab3 GTPase-activating protein catalytic subunit-like [Lingula anatina]|eukprot:XP_013395929.1 rab3 GTPase-activating protein catalytic subunit-like [Lingula anatina]
MADEEPEVFEITDFTTASEWERFIARIEELIHEWKLTSPVSLSPLKKGEYSSGTWEDTTDTLKFADFPFTIVRHCLKQAPNGPDTEEGATAMVEEDENAIPQPLQDILSMENDFPSRAHCLSRWYGIRDFVVISPGATSEAVTSETRINILMSSIAIAVNNTGCQVPVFIQGHQKWRRLYYGLCEFPGVRTSFDMVHLKRIPPQYNHLSGLLDVFKGKLASPISPPPPVTVSVRFTYVLQDWTQYAWPQAPPDIESVTEDEIGCTDFETLPFGACEDPVSELHLSTTWPNLSEEMIVDNDTYTDLDPLQAPQWSVRVQMSEDVLCLLGDYLDEFIAVCYRKESTDQLLGRHTFQEEEKDNADVSKALQRLTEPTVSYNLPSISNVMTSASSKMKMKAEDAPIPEPLLNKLLQFLFPDSVNEDKTEQTSTIGSSKSETSDVTKDLGRQLKSAPVDSLTHKLAICCCILNHSGGGLRALAHLWQEFVLEMRYRWENDYYIIGLEKGSPNLGTSLLHQKLQMLNCCIDRKKTRSALGLEVKHTSISDNIEELGKQVKSSGQDTKGKNSEKNTGKDAAKEKEGEDDDDDDDDEFYECQESMSQVSLAKKTSVADSSDSTSLLGEDCDNEEAISLASDLSGSTDVRYEDSVTLQPEGRLRPCGELKLLRRDEILYIPITQEPAPMTEDMLAEHAEVLANLGSSVEGTHLRARMQSACLLSDMEAFKAANPGCILEDFVRWYSPRDYIEEEDADQDSQGEKKGQLSQRMQIPGNMWVEVWHNAKPVPVRRQKRLFDDTKEAEKVLHFLASLKPGQLALHLMPMLIHGAIIKLQENNDSSIPSLNTLLQQIQTKSSKVTRAPDQDVKKYEDLLNQLRLAELVIARGRSLRNKFQWETEDKAHQGHIEEFASKLLEQPEVEVAGGARGPAGAIIHKLFAEAQKSANMMMNGMPVSPEDNIKNGSDFPKPAGREYILRTVVPRPAPYSRPSAQRMFCVLLRDEFRLAGAFSSDTTFT